MKEKMSMSSVDEPLAFGRHDIVKDDSRHVRTLTKLSERRIDHSF